jgi:hypothetical protein
MADGGRRWGKAGQRLTDSQVRERDASAAATRAHVRARRKADDAVAYRLWRAGELKPYLITQALDAMGLYGPEVDEACGAKEPDVDLWEAGKLYPTWEQLLLLCKLTGKTPRFMCTERPPLALAQTSMRFHVADTHDPPPVWAFDPSAVAVTVAAASPLTTEERT